MTENAPQDSIMDQIDPINLPDDNLPNEYLGFRIRVSSDVCYVRLGSMQYDCREIDLTLDMPQSTVDLEQQDKSVYWRNGSPLMETLREITFVPRRRIQAYKNDADIANEVWQLQIPIINDKAEKYAKQPVVLFQYTSNRCRGEDADMVDLIRIQVEQIYLTNQVGILEHLPICTQMTEEEAQEFDRQYYRKVKA